MFSFKKKVLFGLSVSLVLAMAIGSFALSETQANDTTEVTAGAFTITGESVTENTDYTFSGTTESNGALVIISDKEMTIKNTNSGSTKDRIRVELTDGVDEANITLDGVDINTDQGAAFNIAENATFNVNIKLQDGSKNILKTTSNGAAGLQKASQIDSVGTLTIEGPGELKATGGKNGAGIGGVFMYDTKNIHIINNCKITANGGDQAAGIGSGAGNTGSGGRILGGNATGIVIKDSEVEANGIAAAGIGGGALGSGSEIEITNSRIKAVASDADYSSTTIKLAAAGIGGGGAGSGSKIKITNSTVTATGGSEYSNGNVVLTAAAAIGGGGGMFGNGSWTFNPGTGSENQLDTSSILIAKGGADEEYGSDKVKIATIQGFDEDSGGSLAGVVFEQKTDSDVNEGRVCGNAVLSQDLEIPANLTIPVDSTLSIEKDKEVTLTGKDGAKYIVEGELQNNGTLTLPTSLEVKGNGEITTLLNYDPQGGEIVTTNDDNYITYQDASGVKEYENLPEAIKEGYDLEGWHTEKTGKEDTKVEPTDNVLLNQHTLYANWVEPAPTPTPPTPTPPGPEPTPTPPEPGPEPSPTPEPTPDPSIDPDGGDGGASSKTSDPFMGGIALALLGVATAGAILTRKFK